MILLLDFLNHDPFHPTAEWKIGEDSSEEESPEHVFLRSKTSLLLSSLHLTNKGAMEIKSFNKPAETRR